MSSTELKQVGADSEVRREKASALGKTGRDRNQSITKQRMGTGIG